MGTCRNGQGNVVKCFVHCKTLSRRIIYALFSQPVVGFWAPLGDFRPHTPNLLILGKNPAGANDLHWHKCVL